ncbi:MAG: hypothetical protein AAGA90_10625 [Actinomycetota bacterium]
MTESDPQVDADRVDEAHRQRFAVLLVWLSIAFFVLGYIWLVTATWRNADQCGSVISNPGWFEGSGCYDALYRRSLLGWSAVIGGAASLFAAARYRWGAGWHRARPADGLAER